jgi:preprotein translocase subunit SecG
MQNVLLVVHLMIAVALVGTVLLQKSEGGGLGIGGGGGMGGLMSGRGSANLLTRTTAILAAVFFVTSMGLAWLVSDAREPTSIMDGRTVSQPADEPAGEAPATTPEPVPVGGASDDAPPVPLATESSPVTESLPAPAATPPSEAPPAPAQDGAAGSTEPDVPLAQ